MSPPSLNDRLFTFFSAYAQDLNRLFKNNADLEKFVEIYYTDLYFESTPNHPAAIIGKENILEYIKKNLSVFNSFKIKQSAIAQTKYELIDADRAHADVTWMLLFEPEKELLTFSSTVHYLIWNVQNEPKILGAITPDVENLLKEKIFPE